jgi:hypothetical protein
MSNDLRSHSIAKAMSICLLDDMRKGLMGKNAAFRALQGVADELGQAGESPAQRWDRAFARGLANRCPNGDALQREFNKLSHGGDLPFHWTPQFGDTDPAESARRVTVRSDDPSSSRTRTRANRG